MALHFWLKYKTNIAKHTGRNTAQAVRVRTKISGKKNQDFDICTIEPMWKFLENNRTDFR
jgi:hypothetical protein